MNAKNKTEKLWEEAPSQLGKTVHRAPALSNMNPLLTGGLHNPPHTQRSSDTGQQHHPGSFLLTRSTAVTVSGSLKRPVLLSSTKLKLHNDILIKPEFREQACPVSKPVATFTLNGKRRQGLVMQKVIKGRKVSFFLSGSKKAGCLLPLSLSHPRKIT